LIVVEEGGDVVTGGNEVVVLVPGDELVGITTVEDDDVLGVDGVVEFDGGSVTEVVGPDEVVVVVLDDVVGPICVLGVQSGHVVVVVVLDGTVEEVVELDVVEGSDEVLVVDAGTVVGGTVVDVLDVVDVVEEVVVVVLVVGATVVDVVVVVGGGVGVGHSSTPGSGWPTSKAIAIDRPWASLKKAPMATKFFSALMSTLIGFWPVCRRSSTPGVPTYLQTKTLPEGKLPAGGSAVALGTPHADKRINGSTQRRIGRR
jgi:hypothetical protein